MHKNTFKFWKSVDVEWSYGGSKSVKIPYIYCNCSYVCPPTKMAPKTVEGSIVLWTSEQETTRNKLAKSVSRRFPTSNCLVPVPTREINVSVTSWLVFMLMTQWPYFDLLFIRVSKTFHNFRCYSSLLLVHNIECSFSLYAVKNNIENCRKFFGLPWRTNNHCIKQNTDSL